MGSLLGLGAGGQGHLTAAEREEISRGIAAGTARWDADAAAHARARRPKPAKLATNPLLRGLVVAKLGQDWSPEQIAQWLRREYPDEVAMRISHETIYRDVYKPSRKVVDAKMFHHLRSQRPIRQPRRARPRCAHGRGRIRNMISIRERPAAADTREVAGHWEGDLVFGMRPSAVATLVDRATRYSMIVALPDGYKADVVARALINHLGQLPAHLRRSLTWDRGREMAEHATITAALEMPVSFCDPRHPCQRGTCENTNRLLRQYLQKADLRNFTQDDLDLIATRLNDRPRRVLDWTSPATALGNAEPKGDDYACLAAAVVGCDHGRYGRRTSRTRRRAGTALVRPAGPRPRPWGNPHRMRRHPTTSDHLRMPTTLARGLRPGLDPLPHRAPALHQNHRTMDAVLA